MVLEGEKCQAHIREDEVFSQEIQQLKQLLEETVDNTISTQISNTKNSFETPHSNINSLYVTCLVLIFDSAERLLYV